MLAASVASPPVGVDAARSVVSLRGVVVVVVVVWVLVVASVNHLSCYQV